MEEIWKPIKGYGNKYIVSNLGNVKSVFKNHEKHVNQHINAKGYMCVYLSGKNKTYKHFVHKLVAEAFLDKNEFCLRQTENAIDITKSKLQINHKDENKQNNYVDNLEWCTCSYNINYGQRNHKHSIKMSKKVKQYDLKHKFIKEWNSLIDIQRNLGIPISGIFNANKRKLYKGYYWEY